ncbi:helix-turn-helix domain-containing protein [Burkholderia multivorans]|uniref:helix-turn-helix domain-containing protein n=1 Tax=Burkholderia multivorans TaxID=87883 RepID=UPI00143EEDC6|nr:helix-turn-helix transcriptional regulator [Burkholderia multivorans]QIX18356.1 helix-turn-helix transcriptional regulator [Burkholderia multivorans]
MSVDIITIYGYSDKQAGTQLTRNWLSINGNLGGMKRQDTRRILATNLRRLMQATPDLDTQAKLAARAHISQSSVGRFLSGAVYPQLAQVESIAEVFGITVADLLTDTDATPTSSHAITYDHEAVATLPADQKQQIEEFIAFVVQRNHSKPGETLEIADSSKTPAGLKARLLQAIQRELDDDTLRHSHEEERPSRPTDRGKRTAN